MAKNNKKLVMDELEPSSINLDKSTKAYQKYLSSLSEDKNIVEVKKVVASGENYIRQSQRTEIKKFDESILDELEDGLGAIERIIANPRTFIKEQAELVQVGLAKRVSSLSIRHFATHSQFVRNINENNEVVPEKVLTIYAETDTAIYENRFVMTLIKRCLSFIQMRYNYIMEHGETRDSDLLLIHNVSNVDNITYEIDTRIKVSTPSQDDGNLEKNKNLLQRLNELKNRCQMYFASPFMTEMKSAREVSSPIHMTNMIVKHPDYHKCYLFWEFLEKYEELGVSFDITEVNQEFSKEYLNEINTLIASNVLAIHNNRINDKEIPVSVKKEYVPEVIFTLEDETYEEGKYLYDAYPLAKEVRDNPMPLSPNEVREKDEKIKQKLKNQKDAKLNVTKAINKRKDEVEFLEAEKRKERRNEVFADYDKLINEIVRLRNENDKLNKQIEDLKETKPKKKN